ncbi:MULTISPECIES: GIY-YIG nuclease family protein [Paenibacillus]|uniref:GIY-YIG nuclease family protein n=1 Tax=Paenibacillus TaxID=44249 RepID=UPI0003642DFB|nr:GIY-YIG nuclease family protein [Paenibacillus massiliensis]
MNRRRELIEQYKEIKIEAGVYCIRNTQNGKCFVGSTPNLKSLSGKQFSLNAGSDLNRKLQQEWKEYGEDTFEIEVLELLKKEDSPYFDAKDALKKLEQVWLERLQPFGDKGYN